MSDTWTIGELAEHAARALRAGAPPANGRVRDVPGERLIRWYTTIGLVDPPLTRRGRVARYGRRHLLQLVAIKRLQAAGLSIAEIQAALAGATDRMLEDAADAADPAGTAGHPETAATLDAPYGEGQRGSPPAQDDRTAPGDLARPGGHARPGGIGDLAASDGHARERFWARRPGTDAGRHAAGSAADARAAERVRGAATPHDGTAGPADGRAAPVTRDGHAGPRGERDDPGALVAGVRLGDGVRLVLDVGRTPSEADVHAVLAAAGPLLAVLEERGLI